VTVYVSPDTVQLTIFSGEQALSVTAMKIEAAMTGFRRKRAATA
jgi:hypothetical protein